ncbi:MAG: glycosyltransferase family 1 protein [Bacteroidota bacterium]|nr:glycosyltransferase family 1 protein [Bacteroidota bacterium]
MTPSDNRLHIISFDVPYPPNYGGVIDVYYKIKSLKELGVDVILHTYEYGRARSEELEALCYKVYYYRRKIYKDPVFTKLPYIVATRNSSELLQHLLRDDAPILFEGIHCCYYLAHTALRGRYKIVRTHNIEHIYYKNLARIEKNLFKKYFFSIEAQRLKNFESILLNASAIAAISPDDTKILRLKYKNVFYLPVFHANNEVDILPGKGEYALYHGNLAVGENAEAALYLVNEVFNDFPYMLIIAGSNPGKDLRKATEGRKNVVLLDKVTTSEINQLVGEAQVNVLPTFQNTGMKLKLINVLFKGRHCIVNTKMVRNSGLESLCHVGQDALEIKKLVKKYMQVPFTKDDIEVRKEHLHDDFGNRENAALLLGRLMSSTNLV